MIYKIVQAVQDNGPNYWLVFKGANVWGMDPIASCETREDAEVFVQTLLNIHEQIAQAEGRTV